MLQTSEKRGNSARPILWLKLSRHVLRDREGRRRWSSDVHAHIHLLAHGTFVKSNILPKNTFSYSFLRILNFSTIDLFGKICYTMFQRLCVIVVSNGVKACLMRRGINEDAPGQGVLTKIKRERVQNVEGKSRNVSSIPSGGRTVCVHPQSSFWTVKNDRIVDEVNHLDSKDFLQKLKDRDSQAWGSVRSLIVEPIFRQHKYAEMAKKKSIEIGDAYGYLCLTMLQGERINRSRNPDKLKSWMQSYVRKFILDFYSEKESRFVSIQEHFGARKSGRDAGGNCVVEDPVARIVDEKAEHQRKNEIAFDEKEIVQAAFTKLWAKNPLKAYVLLFKCKNRMSSEDVKSFCRVSTCQNVDKILERARREMVASLKGKIELSKGRNIKMQVRRSFGGKNGG